MIDKISSENIPLQMRIEMDRLLDKYSRDKRSSVAVLVLLLEKTMAISFYLTQHDWRENLIYLIQTMEVYPETDSKASNSSSNQKDVESPS